MEQHLCAYVSYLQDDWVDYLFLTEFAGNNQVLKTTTVSPFFANLGYHPSCDFELDVRTDNPEEQQVQTAVERIQHIYDLVQTEIRYAQVRQEENADQHHIPAPASHHGDMVWVDGRNWDTGRPSRKLENKHHGPYRILRTIGTHTYELDIPATIRKHRTFPVSLLQSAPEDPLPGQIMPPSLPFIVEGEEGWEIEEILNSRRNDTARPIITFPRCAAYHPKPPCTAQPESRTQDLLALRNQNPEPKTSSCCATRIQNPRPPRAAQPEPRTQDLLTPRNPNPEPKTFLAPCRPERSRL